MKQSNAPLPTFSEFGKIAKKILESEKGVVATIDYRTIIVNKGKEATSFSLDKLYRFYIDTTLGGEVDEKTMPTAMLNFLNAYRVKQAQSEIFKIKHVNIPNVLEQCCIR